MNQSTEWTDYVSDALPATPGPDEQRNWAAGFTCRSGVAKVTANNGDGVYTVTEQRHDPGQDQWQDVLSQLGHLAVTARDYRARDTAQSGRLVRFWQQRGIGGELEVILDVGDQDSDEKLKVSQNDTTSNYLGDKLVGDDGEGSNVKVSLVEQNNGGDETLKIVIAKADIPSAAGIEATLLHRINITKGTDAGTYTISTDDWRGRMLLCWLKVIYSDYPEWSGGWGGGSEAGISRYLGSNWSQDPDRALQSASGGDVKIMISKSSGHLYWMWIDNDTGYDCHAMCMIQATAIKTAANYTT